MNKKSLIKIGLFLLIHAVVLAIFSVFYFLIPPYHIHLSLCFWFTYIFSVISVVLGFLISVLAVFGKKDLYSFPVLGVGAAYVVIQLAVSALIRIVLSFLSVPAWVPVILSVLFIGLALIGAVITFISRRTVEKLEEDPDAEKEAPRMRSIKVATKTNSLFRVSIEGVVDACEDAAVKAELVKLGELIRFSDPVSSPATEEMEGKITAKIAELKATVEEGKTEESLTLIKNITNMMKERNRICKMYK